MRLSALLILVSLFTPKLYSQDLPKSHAEAIKIFDKMRAIPRNSSTPAPQDTVAAAKLWFVIPKNGNNVEIVDPSTYTWNPGQKLNVQVAVSRPSVVLVSQKTQSGFSPIYPLKDRPETHTVFLPGTLYELPVDFVLDNNFEPELITYTVLCSGSEHLPPPLDDQLGSLGGNLPPDLGNNTTTTYAVSVAAAISEVNINIHKNGSNNIEKMTAIARPNPIPSGAGLDDESAIVLVGKDDSASADVVFRKKR